VRRMRSMTELEPETVAVLEPNALWQRYEPQMNDYATRAKRPEQAPSYGVPGDL